MVAEDQKIHSAAGAKSNSDLCQILLRCPLRADGVWINRRQIGRGHETHTRDGANVIDVFTETPKRAFGFFSRALRGWLPFLARRVCAPPEINAVPKLFVHPLARVIKNADQSAAFRAEPIGN